VAVTGAPRSDVVVVGAGVIGAACAYELAGAGLRVTLVERGEPGAEASGASAGLLSAFSPARDGLLAELYRQGRDLYAPLGRALAEESGIDIHHEQGGHVHLCLSDREAEAARTLAAAQKGGSERVEFLDEAALRALEPAVTPRARGALSLPGNEWVHNGRLVAALVEAARRRGVRLVLGHPVEELCRAADRVTGVRARGMGTLPAGAVVLAAGAWSSEIAGVPSALRLGPVKGQILALGSDPPLLRRAILSGEIYLVPRLSGECVVGATVEPRVGDKTVTAEAVAWLLREAVAAVPGLGRAPFLRAWAGLRPATADGLPVVGPWPGLPGLLVAAGHARSGIVLAPVTARIVRDFVVEGRSSRAAEILSPARLGR
jgi:glycine oxidase